MNIPAPTSGPRPSPSAGRSALALALAAIVLAACAQGADRGTSGADRGATGAGTSGDALRDQLRFVVVTHGSSSDPFWSVVIHGVEDAARDMGVRAEYQSPNSFDMVAMSQLVDAAVASVPDGLVVSIPDADALAPSIRAATEAGIPVVSINSGLDVYASLGALVHVGQPEYDAGYAAGERFVAEGVRRALCVNHEVGNVGLDRRCQGFQDALAAAGVPSAVLAVDLADPEDTRQRIRGALAADPSIEAVLVLGAIAAGPALAALERGAGQRPVALATFDLSPSVLDAVAEGDILFAVDQQQYLQGYLPIVFLTKYLETGTLPGGGQPIATGPGFVTRENAARVRALSERGIR